MAHTCNPSILGGQGGQIIWAEEFETSLGNMVKPYLYKTIKTLASVLCPDHMWKSLTILLWNELLQSWQKTFEDSYLILKVGQFFQAPKSKIIIDALQYMNPHIKLGSNMICFYKSHAWKQLRHFKYIKVALISYCRKQCFCSNSLH